MKLRYRMSKNKLKNENEKNQMYNMKIIIFKEKKY